jgi:hypothetical protein
MTVSREMATAFVESYGQTWQSWDYGGFVELFSGCQGRLKMHPLSPVEKGTPLDVWVS